MRRILPVCLTLALLGAGCESIPSKTDGGLPELKVVSVEPSLVLPGTWIHVKGEGFVDENQGTLMVFLERGGDRRMVVPERIDDGHIRFQISASLFTALGGPGSFMGTVKVQVDYTGGQSQSHTMEVIWTLEETLHPRLDRFHDLDDLPGQDPPPAQSIDPFDGHGAGEEAAQPQRVDQRAGFLEELDHNVVSVLLGQSGERA